MTGYPSIPRLCPRFPGDDCGHQCQRECALLPHPRSTERTSGRLVCIGGVYVREDVTARELAALVGALDVR